MVGDAVGPCAATKCRVERITTTAPVKVRLPHWWRFRRRISAVEIGVIAEFPCSASSSTSGATLFPSPALIAQVPQQHPANGSRQHCHLHELTEAVYRTTHHVSTTEWKKERQSLRKRTLAMQPKRKVQSRRRVTPTSPLLVTVFGHLHTRGTTARKNMKTSHPYTRRPSTHAGIHGGHSPTPIAITPTQGGLVRFDVFEIKTRHRRVRKLKKFITFLCYQSCGPSLKYEEIHHISNFSKCHTKQEASKQWTHTHFMRSTPSTNSEALASNAGYDANDAMLLRAQQ